MGYDQAQCAYDKRGKIFSVISKETALAARDGGGDPALTLPAHRDRQGEGYYMPATTSTVRSKRARRVPVSFMRKCSTKATVPVSVSLLKLQPTIRTVRPGGTQITGKNAASRRGRCSCLQFDRKGQFIIDASKTDEETLMDIAEAGAEDIITEDTHFEVLCPMSEYTMWRRLWRKRASKQNRPSWHIYQILKCR